MAELRKSALLIIGNEILSGRTAEKNLRTLALGLRKVGRAVGEARIVRDEVDDVVAATNELRKTHEFLFTSGGIGPTHDDITTKCIAKALGVPVVRHKEAEKTMRAHYEATGREATEERLSMADIPDGAELIACEATPAPGYKIKNIYVFAGVPFIFESMARIVLGSMDPQPALHSRTVTIDAGESSVARQLGDLQNKYLELEIGSYPQDKNGRHYAELVLSGCDLAVIDKAVSELTETLAMLNIPWEE